jgi:hypothetical protein
VRTSTIAFGAYHGSVAAGASKLLPNNMFVVADDFGNEAETNASGVLAQL